MKGQQQQQRCASSSHTHTYQKTYIVYRHPQKFFLTQKIRVRTFFQSSKTMRKHTNSTIHDIVYVQHHHLGPKMTKNLRSGGGDGTR